MEDNVTNYNIPDFGPDDDTEDMTGVLIYDPDHDHKDDIPKLSDLPAIPPELNINYDD